MTTETPKWRFRLRFSILNLLLVATIIAMALVIYRQYRDLRGLRQTLGDAGYLEVTDESKYHAIAIPTYDELTWRWRVWLPEGKQYEFVALCNQIPQVGLPARESQLAFSRFTRLSGESLATAKRGWGGGEYLVALRMIPDGASTAGTLRLEVQSGGAGRIFAEPVQINGGQFPIKSVWDYTVEGTPGGRLLGAGGERFVLLRTSAYGSAMVPVDLENEPSKDGLMLWIEPIEE